jgi:ParB family transcriptional regulator, chromosome partitioning protein
MIAKIRLDSLGSPLRDTQGGMEKKSCTSVEVDLGSLDLRYAHTRIARPKHVEMIASSIERFDQITPVLIIPEDERLVLIHGFVRMAAIRKLGRDTIRGDIQEISEVQALYHLLADTQERQWEALEQAWIIRDLKERLGCSLTEIARGIGYDPSWVSRRLSLIEGLPEEILRSVATGSVSTYAASRVLVPLARANTHHAQRLVAHLAHHRLSTRELAGFFKHYEASNKQTRERMIADPSLFLKAKQSRDEKTTADALRQGPEGAWIRDWEMIKAIVRRIGRQLSTVIYPGQDSDDRMRLLRPYRDVAAMMEEIEQKIAGIENQ